MHRTLPVFLHVHRDPGPGPQGPSAMTLVFKPMRCQIMIHHCIPKQGDLCLSSENRRVHGNLLTGVLSAATVGAQELVQPDIDRIFDSQKFLPIKIALFF